MQDTDFRLRAVENEVAQMKAETTVYIKQLSNNIDNIRAVVDSLKNKQMNEAEIKNIVRETIDSIAEKQNTKESKLITVIIELVKVVATGVTIVAGMQIVAL